MRWRPYVPVHQRKANGLAQAQRAIGKGKTLQPIRVEGRKIAKTFWGNSWCTHLEEFSDFSNRLPRGRTYARNGSIVHLEIATGKITAMVAGSDLYKIKIKIDKMPAKAWQRLCDQCASSVTSTIDLLRGKLPEPVLETLTHPDNDLFPSSSEIHLDCDCPDWADLCKHLAAVLYGVGSRLDDSPELLFKLRGVDPNDLIGSALVEATSTNATDANTILPGTTQLEANSNLEDIFGVELIEDSTPAKKKDASGRRKKAITRKKKATKKKVAKASAAKKKVAKKKAVKKSTKKRVATKKVTKKKAVKKKATPATKKKATTKKSQPKKKRSSAANPVKKATKKKTAQSKATKKKTATRKKTTKKTTTQTRRKKTK